MGLGHEDSEARSRYRFASFGKTTNSSGLTGLLGLCFIKLKDFREVEQQGGVWEDLMDDLRGYGI